MRTRIFGSLSILLCGLLVSRGRRLRGRPGRRSGWRCVGLLVAGLAVSAPAREEFDLQRYFDWKIAICYHPMYMLVDEDRGEPVLSERIPPFHMRKGSEFIQAEAPDGTGIPTYFATNVRDKTAHDTYNAEGVWAEAHARAGKEAEEMAVQAGNLLALARLAGQPLDNWSNRIHSGHWAKLNAKHNYDLNLYGRQTIEYEVIPFGAFDGARVVRAVEDLMAPVFACPGAGQESSKELGDPNLAVTALFEKGGEVWARGYRIPGRPSTQFRDWEIFNAPLHSLKGQP